MSVISLLTASCIFEPTLDPDAGLPGSGTGEEAEIPMIGIGIKVPTKAGVADGYQMGDFYENHIDVEKQDYRIYFFTEDNRFIARFIPTIITPIVESETYTRYNFHGKVPAGVVSGSTFKVVVIANWGTYYDTLLKPGETTIDDLCNDKNWATFSYVKDHVLSFNMKMPFFGVREFKNQVIAVSDNELPVTLAPVDLLRAMARVEVVVDADSDFNGMSLERVYVDRYNAKGFCAPTGVTHQDHYVHNNWDLDYAKSIHILDSGQRVHKSLNFRKISEKTATTDEVWMAYLLEYDHNSINTDDHTKINLKFDNFTDPFEIQFVEYDQGKPKSPIIRYDIKRNNLYRFRVTADLLVFPEFSVYVDPFDEHPEVNVPL